MDIQARPRGPGGQSGGLACSNVPVTYAAMQWIEPEKSFTWKYK